MQIPIYPILYLNLLPYFLFSKRYDMACFRELKQNKLGKNMHTHNFQLFIMTKELLGLISDRTSVPKVNEAPLNFSTQLTIMERERNYRTSNSFFNLQPLSTTFENLKLILLSPQTRTTSPTKPINSVHNKELR